MREQCFCLGCAAVQTVAEKSRSVAVKEAERRFHHVCNTLLSDIRSGTERRKVSAHQRGKIYDDAAEGESERQPAVFCDLRRLRPVRRNAYKVSCRQPDADVWDHSHYHSNG